MLSLNNKLRREFLEKYLNSIARVPGYLAAHDRAVAIGKAWTVNDLQGRHFSIDRSVPFILRLKLGPHDDLCREGMLFLEHVEELFNIKFSKDNGNYYDTDGLVKFSSPLIWILFAAYDMNRCQIVEKLIPRPGRVERVVIC